MPTPTQVLLGIFLYCEVSNEIRIVMHVFSKRQMEAPDRNSSATNINKPHVQPVVLKENVSKWRKLHISCVTRSICSHIRRIIGDAKSHAAFVTFVIK